VAPYSGGKGKREGMLLSRRLEGNDEVQNRKQKKRLEGEILVEAMKRELTEENRWVNYRYS